MLQEVSRNYPVQDNPMMETGIAIQRSFNVDVEKISNGFIVRGSRRYNHKTYCESISQMKEIICKMIDESFKEDVIREGESL